ncbi:MAG: hypothetical protein ABRQ38_27250 [Candidatus Eremiobacterota bacterium]
MKNKIDFLKLNYTANVISELEEIRENLLVINELQEMDFREEACSSQIEIISKYAYLSKLVPI